MVSMVTLEKFNELMTNYYWQLANPKYAIKMGVCATDLSCKIAPAQESLKEAINRAHRRTLEQLEAAIDDKIIKDLKAQEAETEKSNLYAKLYTGYVTRAGSVYREKAFRLGDTQTYTYRIFLSPALIGSDSPEDEVYFCEVPNVQLWLTEFSERLRLVEV